MGGENNYFYIKIIFVKEFILEIWSICNKPKDTVTPLNFPTFKLSLGVIWAF